MIRKEDKTINGECEKRRKETKWRTQKMSTIQHQQNNLNQIPDASIM
jgi:hypothetical protein